MSPGHGQDLISKQHGKCEHQGSDDNEQTPFLHDSHPLAGMLTVNAEPRCDPGHACYMRQDASLFTFNTSLTIAWPRDATLPGV